MPEDEKSSLRHRSHREKDKTRDRGNSRKRHKHEREEESSSHRSKRHRDRSKERGGQTKSKSKSKVDVIDDDPDEDMWVEKNIDMDGETPLAQGIPTAASLKLTSRAGSSPGDPQPPPSLASETKLERDEWMLMPPSVASITQGERSAGRSALQIPTGNESLTEEYGEPTHDMRTMGGGVDFFSSLGTERKKKPKEEKPDPEKMKVSSKELNTNLVQGIPLDQYPHTASKASTPGGPGSNWRMMKLRRVFEAAEEEGKPIEEVALERYGSLGAFEEAKEERRVLDEREGKRSAKGKNRDKRGGDEDQKGREHRYMFTDIGGSNASSRSQSFRRPGESTPSTPSPVPPADKRLQSIRAPPKGSPLSMSHSPIPSVMTPPALMRSTAGGGGGRNILSTEELNRMQARVLKAKLMSDPDADKLEKDYEAEVRRAAGGTPDGDADEDNLRTNDRVEVVPTLDARGRLYDIGSGSGSNIEPSPSGNRRKKAEKFETRDSKTGEMLRYNADDDSITLGEMLRQERFGAGPADQKNLDIEMANAIARDGGFMNNLDYIDDNAERLGRKKMKSDAMKRQFAINDYKRTQKVLASCQFCYGDDDSPPKAPVIAMATRCYLSCTLSQELVEGHCLIVPIQHHLTMLDGDDDLWDEVRNFMKCVLRMFAEEDKGVIFYETILSLKYQKHTFIECVPVPWDAHEELPAYFKESILMAETEWSQHKKLIDFSTRPGGFRRMMVPNLPYFMVQFDHKGEKGYGHVIEGTSEAAGADEEGGIDEGEKGGGEFPRWFAGEIVGNVLEVEPRRWRRPKRIDSHFNKERVQKFRKKYDKFDWTGLIGKE